MFFFFLNTFLGIITFFLKYIKTHEMSFPTEESFEVDCLLRERTIRIHSLSLNFPVRDLNKPN